MTEEYDDEFEMILYRDLESWFAVDYFLCDFCVEDFRNLWRGIEINDRSFSSDLLPIDLLYDARLALRYSLSEFERLIQNVRCPNCGNYQSCNIWPYNLPPGIKNHIKDIEEIAELSKRAPFMIMEHPFSREILELLKRIFECSQNVLIDFDVYRSRIIEDGAKKYDIEKSGTTPDFLAKEGRFNHAGYGFLYAATTKQLSFKEVVYDDEKSVSIATIRFLKKLKILDLTNIEEYDDDIYRTIMTSALMHNPNVCEGWDKPGYIFTRFIADCAIHIGFEAIKYNSKHSFDGHNLVILRDKTDKDFNWDVIYKIQTIDIYKNKNIL